MFQCRSRTRRTSVLRQVLDTCSNGTSQLTDLSASGHLVIDSRFDYPSNFSNIGRKNRKATAHRLQYTNCHPFIC